MSRQTVNTEGRLIVTIRDTRSDIRFIIVLTVKRQTGHEFLAKLSVELIFIQRKIVMARSALIMNEKHEESMLLKVSVGCRSDKKVKVW